MSYTDGGFGPRYVVRRVDGLPCRPESRYVVLDYFGADPHAVRVLYEADNPALTRGLRAALRDPESAPPQHEGGGGPARLLVYIAGPYSAPDVAVNVRAAMRAWRLLWDAGFAPVCPHLSHFLHMQEPLPYERWLEYDLCLLRVCAAVVRLPGGSPGADREVRAAEDARLPVFFSLPDLLAWRDSL